MRIRRKNRYIVGIFLVMTAWVHATEQPEVPSSHAAPTSRHTNPRRHIFGQGAFSVSRRDLSSRYREYVGLRRSTAVAQLASSSPSSPPDSIARDEPATRQVSKEDPAELSEPNLPDYPWDDLTDDSAPMNDEKSPKGSIKTPPQQQQSVDLLEYDEADDIIWSRQGTPRHEMQAEEAQQETFAHSPVLYRYFGRSRSRLHTADSVPFIVLGPSVEHWKTIGGTLAFRGFSVMVCELVDKREDKQYPDEGKNLVLAILDALRWKRAILVGCDGEAAMAIQAATQLAPDRVAGLVLCGDLSYVEKMARKSIASRMAALKSQRIAALDRYLQDNVDCPFTIVWDGNEGQRPSRHVDKRPEGADMFAFNRCLLLGGGSAPHRRLPERFAWVLTRFVEEKIVPLMAPLPTMSQKEESLSESQHRHGYLPFGLDEAFAPEGFVVVGRVIATALLYATAMKVAVYQYENVRNGILSFHNVVQWLLSWRRRVVQGAVGFVKVNLLGHLWFRGRRVVASSEETGFEAPEEDGRGKSQDDNNAGEQGAESPQVDRDDSVHEDKEGSRRLHLLDPVVA